MLYVLSDGIPQSNSPASGSGPVQCANVPPTLPPAGLMSRKPSKPTRTSTRPCRTTRSSLRTSTAPRIPVGGPSISAGPVFHSVLASSLIQFLPLHTLCQISITQETMMGFDATFLGYFIIFSNQRKCYAKIQPRNLSPRFSALHARSVPAQRYNGTTVNPLQPV